MQMSPSQQTQSRGWLKALSLPAFASGRSRSRCLCTPRSSPPSMKVRVCCYLLSVLFSPPYQFSVFNKVVMSSMFMFSRKRRFCLLGHTPFCHYRYFILSGFLSGSAGNSHSSTQMNSYSDSGYQDVSSGYLSGQNMSKAELRMQHSYPGAVVRNTRAEGQAAAQVQPILYYCCWACEFLADLLNQFLWIKTVWMFKMFWAKRLRNIQYGACLPKRHWHCYPQRGGGGGINMAHSKVRVLMNWFYVHCVLHNIEATSKVNL